MPIGGKAPPKAHRSAELDVGNRARKDAQANGTDEHRLHGIGHLVYTNQMPPTRLHIYGTGERMPNVLTAE